MAHKGIYTFPEMEKANRKRNVCPIEQTKETVGDGIRPWITPTFRRTKIKGTAALEDLGDLYRHNLKTPIVLPCFQRSRSPLFERGTPTGDT